MFNSQYPNAFSDPHGTIILSARILHNGQHIETHVIDANAENQTAEVQIPGRFNLTVQFSQVLNVALKYSGGEVIENFGAPRTARPASLEFIRGVQYA